MMVTFEDALKERILILDGALGTMIQKHNLTEGDFRGREFISHPTSVAGFNDILNLSKPNLIKEIHRKYIEAGANIITTNTFNSNPISMKDYGLNDIPGLVRRLNREGAAIARDIVEEYLASENKSILFVGGSIGPTNRSASLSPDISNPLDRNVSYHELYEGYREQVRGLIEGGVDLLIFETFFDTLNIKAGLEAANSVMNDINIYIPIIVSATVSDNSGRILSGQTPEAFLTSVSHYDNVKVIGLNCGFGADEMQSFIERINKINPHYTSCHPNAGLPDEMGCYNVNPEEFKDSVRKLMGKSELNIIGGCCGTTPEYVRLLSELIKEFQPRKNLVYSNNLSLSGLERLEISDGFLTIGERCNVAGSAKFLRLIKERSFEEASELAKNQIEKGAQVLDINMDDPLLNTEEAMIDFIRYILAEPEIAKVPFMIDSSNWNVIESCLKNIQGKGIVNSLSLKEGEEIFIKNARRVKELGFALIVMAFDEKGQADTFERKIEICKRSYNILTEKCGFSPQDIIFDVNVMTIATGMKEHSKYAIDFIKTIEWIKANLPGTRTSGGISNLSFAFRGKNKIREYMHVVFLYHAIKSGLDMAIINPSQKTKYEDIPLNLRQIIEDIIFDTDPTAVDKLLNYVIEEEEDNKLKNLYIEKTSEIIPIEELLKQQLIKGDLKNLEKNISIALNETKDPLKIIEGPLLEGMKKVGELFGEGKMYLPQVIKTARTMKRAVEILTPYIEKSGQKETDKKNGRILIATVKGDVHDIGKNIVSTVLACNNYEIIDLGIMVEPQKILDTTLKEKPDIICLSGLITPSLAEMSETVKMLSNAGIKIPVMIGGAATSLIHTALKIDPEYIGTVLHMSDASQNPIVASKLLNPEIRDVYLNALHEKYCNIREKSLDKDKLLSFERVLEILKKNNRNNYNAPKPNVELGQPVIINIPFEDIVKLINWKMFFITWKLQNKYLDSFPYNGGKKDIQDWLENIPDEDKGKTEEVVKIYNNAQEILHKIQEGNKFDGKGLVRFEHAKGDLRNIVSGDTVFPMLRQQREDSELLSCSDFIGHSDNNYIGFFAVTAGENMVVLSKSYEKKGEIYKSLITQTLADRLAEASAEWLQRYVNKEFMTVSIRPAWGYPMLPDQTLIFKTTTFLPYDEIGIKLTENGAMYPPASISGLYFSNPKAKYFMVGKIGEDQIKDYAQRRDISEKRVKELLRQL